MISVIFSGQLYLKTEGLYSSAIGASVSLFSSLFSSGAFLAKIRNGKTLQRFSISTGRGVVKADRQKWRLFPAVLWEVLMAQPSQMWSVPVPSLFR